MDISQYIHDSEKKFKSMKLALIYLDSPLIIDGDGFQGKSIMNMFRHFPSYYDTDLVCQVSSKRSDEGYAGDGQ